MLAGLLNLKVFCCSFCLEKDFYIVAIMGRFKDGVWEYVTVLTGYPSAGTKRWKCNYCEGVFSGTVNRIKLHLSKVGGHDIKPCCAVPEDVADFYAQELLRHGELGGTSTAGAIVPTQNSYRFGTSSLGGSGAIDSRSSDLPTTRHIASTQLLHARQNSAMQQVMVNIRRCFYECNIPFHVANTPTWKSMINSIAELGVDNFHGPNRESLRGSHLHDEVEVV